MFSSSAITLIDGFCFSSVIRVGSEGLVKGLDFMFPVKRVNRLVDLQVTKSKF